LRARDAVDRWTPAASATACKFGGMFRTSVMTVTIDWPVDTLQSIAEDP